MNPSVKNIVTFAKIYGCWYSFNNQYGILLQSFQYFRLFFLFIFPAFNFSFLFKTDFSPGFHKHLVFLPGGFFIFVKPFLLSFKSSKLVDFTFKINIVTSKHYNVSWKLDILNKNLSWGWKAIFFVILGGFLFWFFFWPLRYILDSVFLYFEVIKCPTIVPLPVSGFIEDKCERTPAYWLGEISTTIWGVFNIFAFFSVDGLFIIFILCITAEMNILRHELTQLKLSNESEKKNFLKLSELCERHIIIIGLRQDFNSVFGLVFGFQSVFSSVVMCMHALATLLADSIQTYYTMAIATVMFCIVNFADCYFGELLSTENERVFEAIYDLAWYQENLDFQKTINMMLRQARKPYTAGFKDNSPIGIEMFGNILETTYKLYTVFRSVKTEQ